MFYSIVMKCKCGCHKSRKVMMDGKKVTMKPSLCTGCYKNHPKDPLYEIVEML